MKAYIIISEIRDRVVIPFCEKQRLSFSAGMGTWAFYTLDEPKWAKVDGESSLIIEEDDGLENPLTNRTLRGSVSVCRLLNLSVPGVDNGYGIGSLMEDYTPEDL